MRLTRAGLAAIDLEPLRPLAPSPSEFFDPREHYRLLAYLSRGARRVVDIGTNYGASALAFSYGAEQVDTFDIVDRPGRPMRPNIAYHIEDLCDPAIRERRREMLLESTLIFIDIDPHEGTRELELLGWLRVNRYAGLIVLDDIWFFKAMRDNLWYRIESRFKTDVTAFGHWSGTGIVSFGETRVELEGAVDTSNWTLVTGYFDLTAKEDATDEIRARPATHYIDEHGSSVLSLDKNLIVFCDPALEERMWAMRPAWLHDRTEVVSFDFESFPLTGYRDRIIANRGGPSCARDPRNTASYYLFCMARYAMLKNAIRENPFGSTHFAWINICIERMGFKNLIRLDEALSVQRDGFSTCWIDYVSKDRVRDLPSYFGARGCRECAAPCSMCSGFFTANAPNMIEFCNRIEATFLRCLKAGFGHADEQLFPIVYYERPALFDWYIGDYAEMIANYASVYENPEAPLRNLVRSSLEAGDFQVCARASGMLLEAHDAGACALDQETLEKLQTIVMRAV